MRASQEARWKARIRENEGRRRRFEEASKRLEADEKEQAQRALELRRAERARMDDLMRHPAQAPAPPRKPILRKGAGAVLLRAGRAAQAQCAATAAAASPNSRSPPGTAAARQRPGTVPAQAALSSPAEEQQQQQQQQQVAWRQGLQLYIAHQRRAAADSDAAGPAAGDAAAEGLSWRDLKLAAEAGFEELLRLQVAAAPGSAEGGPTAWRRLGMTRVKGGGGSSSTCPPVHVNVVLPGLDGQPPTASASAAAAAGNSLSVSPSKAGHASACSKWAARRQLCQDGRPATGGSTAANEQAHNQADETAAPTVPASQDDPVQQHCSSTSLGGAAKAPSKPDAAAEQHLTAAAARAAAARAAAALRESMKQLHRSGELAKSGSGGAAAGVPSTAAPPEPAGAAAGVGASVADGNTSSAGTRREHARAHAAPQLRIACAARHGELQVSKCHTPAAAAAAAADEVGGSESHCDAASDAASHPPALADEDAAATLSTVADASGCTTPAAAAAAPGSTGPTLDSLLAKVQQLAALRRAVATEFAAMGRSRVAAVMGAWEQPAPSDSSQLQQTSSNSFAEGAASMHERAAAAAPTAASAAAAAAPASAVPARTAVTGTEAPSAAAVPPEADAPELQTPQHGQAPAQQQQQQEELEEASPLHEVTQEQQGAALLDAATLRQPCMTSNPLFQDACAQVAAMQLLERQQVAQQQQRQQPPQQQQQHEQQQCVQAEACHTAAAEQHQQRFAAVGTQVEVPAVCLVPGPGPAWLPEEAQGVQPSPSVMAPAAAPLLSGRVLQNLEAPKPVWGTDGCSHYHHMGEVPGLSLPAWPCRPQLDYLQTSPASAGCGGSSSVLDGCSPSASSSHGHRGSSSSFLSKLASKAANAVKSAVSHALTAGQQQQQYEQQCQQQHQHQHQHQQQPTRSPRPGAAAAAASQAGGYFTAALQAQQRAEAEAAERQRLAAAADAVKQAAAKRLAAEKREGQRKAAELVAQHRKPAPLAIGSFAQLLQVPSCQQQQTGEHARPDSWQQPDAQQDQHAVVQRQQQPCLPCGGAPSHHVQPPSSPPRGSSPQRKAVWQQPPAAAPASDTGVFVSRIPSAPGAPPEASSNSPSPRRGSTARAAAAQHCSSMGEEAAASDSDDDFAHLERELHTPAACAPMQSAAPARAYARPVGSGGRGSQAAEACGCAAAARPAVTPLLSVLAAGSGGDGSQGGIWAAVQAAAEAAASRGDSAVVRASPHACGVAMAASPGRDSSTPRAAQPKHTGTAVQLPPPPVRAMAAGSPKVSGPGSSYGRAAASNAARAQASARGTVAAGTPVTGLALAGAPGSAHTRDSPVWLQQPSRLSVEEAQLLAELHQLDRRMAGQDQGTGWVPRTAAQTAVLPALAGARGAQNAPGSRSVAAAAGMGGRRLPSRGVAAPGVSSSGCRPGAASQMQPMAAEAPASRVVKLAAVRGATVSSSRGSSRSGNDTAAGAVRDTSPQAAGRVVRAPPGSGSSRLAAKPVAASPNKAKGLREQRLVAAAGGNSWAGDKQPLPAGQPPLLPAAMPAGAGSMQLQGWPSGVQQQQQQAWGAPHSNQGLPGFYGWAPAAVYAAQQPGFAGGMSMAPLHAHPGMAMWPAGQQQQAMEQLWYAQQQQQLLAWQQQHQQHPGLSNYTPPCPQQFGFPQGPPGCHGQQPPGSPLLPTLHYQQTVMRDRTSSSRGSELMQCSQALQPGYGAALSPSRADMAWGSRDGGSSGSGSVRWGAQQQQQQQQHACIAGTGGASGKRATADVWPPRGLGLGSRAERGGDDEGVVVAAHNAHLLLG